MRQASPHSFNPEALFATRIPLITANNTDWRWLLQACGISSTSRMKFYDFHKFIVDSTAFTLRKIAAFNPFTIHKKGARTKAVFALALVCFFWGTTWVASKEGVRHMPALELAGARQAIAGIIYVIFFLARGATLPKGREWIPILVLSFLNFFMSNGLSTWGVQYISAGLGSIMGAIFPLWLVVIGMFSSKKRLPRNAIIGLV